MDGLAPHSAAASSSSSVVRPKERRLELNQQNPFVRGNTIIRSKTFSPGPQSQYICRVNAHTHINTFKHLFPQGFPSLSIFVIIHSILYSSPMSPDQPKRQRQLHSVQEVSFRPERLREAQRPYQKGKRYTFNFILEKSPSLKKKKREGQLNIQR